MKEWNVRPIYGGTLLDEIAKKRLLSMNRVYDPNDWKMKREEKSLLAQKLRRQSIINLAREMSMEESLESKKMQDICEEEKKK